MYILTDDTSIAILLAIACISVYLLVKPNLSKGTIVCIHTLYCHCIIVYSTTSYMYNRIADWSHFI